MSIYPRPLLWPPTVARFSTRDEVVVVAYHDTYADSTMPVIPYPTLTKGHPDKSEYEAAERFCKEIVATAQRIEGEIRA